MRALPIKIKYPGLKWEIFILENNYKKMVITNLNLNLNYNYGILPTISYRRNSVALLRYLRLYCVHIHPFVYSGITTFTLYICDALNKQSKDKKKTLSIVTLHADAQKHVSKP